MDSDEKKTHTFIRGDSFPFLSVKVTLEPDKWDISFHAKGKYYECIYTGHLKEFFLQEIENFIKTAEIIDSGNNIIRVTKGNLSLQFIHKDLEIYSPAGNDVHLGFYLNDALECEIKCTRTDRGEVFKKAAISVFRDMLFEYLKEEDMLNHINDPTVDNFLEKFFAFPVNNGVHYSPKALQSVMTKMHEDISLKFVLDLMKRNWFIFKYEFNHWDKNKPIIIIKYKPMPRKLKYQNKYYCYLRR